MATPEMKTIEGVLSRMIWKAADSDFVIAEVDVDEVGKITVKGALTGAKIGGCYRIEGPVAEDSFGEHVKIRSSLPIIPKSAGAIRAYLETLPGIGGVRAKALVRKFGDQALEKLKTAGLDELKGVGLRMSEKKLQEVRLVLEGAESSAEIKLTVATLLGDEGGDKSVKKVLDAWGKDAPNVIKEHPWRLTEVPSFGFARADAVARHLGHALDSPERIEAGILHAMGEIRSNGNTVAHATSLVDRTETALDIGYSPHGYRELIVDAIGRLRKTKTLVELSGDRLQLFSDRVTEDFIGETMRARLARDTGWSEARLHEHYDLAEDQLEAVKLIVNSPTAILMGAPGTGKTYAVRELLRSYAVHKVKLCAPTGKAARRLAESTGYKAQTIHTLLEPQPRNERGTLKFGFSRNAGNPLDADAVIVDEFSMVDEWLFEQLLVALPSKCRLVLVGDPNQLASVGPGAVLRDLIAAKKLPIAELTTIKRTNPGALLTHIHEVREGRWSKVANEKEANLFVIPADGFKEAAATMAKLYLDRLPKMLPDGADPIMAIQLLVPWRTRTEVSVFELNAAIHDERIRRGDVTLIKPRFGIGEKVIQTANDYEIGIVNGDIGRIVKIEDRLPEGAEKEVCCYVIDFEGYEDPVSVPAFSNSLELAYAITIHKSQGSEWPIVVIPAMGTTSPFYDRSLFYTALSRAKSYGVLVGNQDNLWRVLGRSSLDRRMTNLVDCMTLREEIVPVGRDS